MSERISLDVNGAAWELPGDPDRSLLSALRDEVGLTGAKPGCGEGVCGACTVLVDGEAVRSCQRRLSEVSGAHVTTIEGLSAAGALHPVQQAFLDVAAFQCGYCTPGMVLRTVALLDRTAEPGDAEIRAALDGNVCRCGTYPRILRAVRGASELRESDRDAAVHRAAAFALPAPGRVTIEARPREPWDLVEARARDYFAVLPEGLVVVHEADPGRENAWTTSSSAWLHIGSDGVATAFTGKVDVGQDNRTALALRVAAGLRSPLSSVRMVMGDTDVCPFDAGTFGSRSMPDAGALLASLAASARDSLVRRAAARWDLPADQLVGAEGCVMDPQSGRSIGYGELVRGLREVEVAAGHGSPTEPVVEHSQAPRLDAIGVVTGSRRYTSDLARPGMLHGRVLRPPAQGSTLRSVDTTEAAVMPGVVVVHDGSFVGVAATGPMAAAAAVRAIRAEWDPEAQPAESDLDAYLRAHPVEERGWGGAFHQESGDPEPALASAPIRLAATYTTAYIAHVALETHAALAEWDPDGRLTVWTGTQIPFGVRRELSEELSVPESRVRVVVPDTGGGFGGKHAGVVALEAARLARAAGRPVKVRWSRADEFATAHLRPAALIDVRSGARPDGTITAWAMATTNAGTFGLAGPYEIANQRLDYQPARSPLPQGSYRSLAAAANHFARESHMDEVAAALGIDPLALRLAHLRDERLATVLRTAAERIDWHARRPAGVGVGIACGVEKGGQIATAV